MTNTINYDKPVENLIDQLSATGHVTHTSFKKTSVTLHHNGAVGLTHEDVLNGWKTRESSAHFDVDKNGAIAQYVAVNERAWAVGNNEGNDYSISIEQANVSGSPNWEVSSTTTSAACRLAGWLFAHVIGEAPSSSNFFPHQHWSATDCPGPFVMKEWANLLSQTRDAYNTFKAQPTPPSSPSGPTSSGPEKLVEDGELGPKTIKRWQQIMGTPADGVISEPKSDLVVAVQEKLNLAVKANLKVDGNGIIQDGKEYKTVKALQKYLGTTQDGFLSVPKSECIVALQKKLNTGSF